MKSLKYLTWVAGAVVIVTPGLGCSSTKAESGAPESRTVAESLSAETVGKALVDYSTLSEIMPGATFTASDGSQKPITEAVVVGTVTDAQVMHAFRSPTGDEERTAPDGIEVDTQSDDADWYQYRLTVEVERMTTSFVGSADKVMHVTMTASPSGTGADGAIAELKGLGKVAILAYRPNIDGWEEWAIAGQSRLLATVAEHEELAYPWVSSQERASYVEQAPDLDSLFALMDRM